MASLILFIGCGVRTPADQRPPNCGPRTFGLKTVHIGEDADAVWRLGFREGVRFHSAPVFGAPWHEWVAGIEIDSGQGTGTIFVRRGSGFVVLCIKNAVNKVVVREVFPAQSECIYMNLAKDLLFMPDAYGWDKMENIYNGKRSSEDS
jgi:hypothetical protein